MEGKSSKSSERRRTIIKASESDESKSGGHSASSSTDKPPRSRSFLENPLAADLKESVSHSTSSAKNKPSPSSSQLAHQEERKRHDEFEADSVKALATSLAISLEAICSKCRSITIGDELSFYSMVLMQQRPAEISLLDIQEILKLPIAPLNPKKLLSRKCDIVYVDGKKRLNEIFDEITYDTLIFYNGRLRSER